MKPDELKARLRGVLSFPATPFHEDLSLNLDGLRGNLEWLRDSGVNVIAPACGTGEFFNLTLEEYRQVVETAVEAVQGRVPMIAGTGHGPMMAVEFARVAQEAGIDALLVLPPYLITPEQDGLVEYVAGIARAVDISLILYNRSNAIYSAGAVEKLLQFENIIAFKDGSGDLDHFSMMRREFGDRLVWLNGMPTAEMTAPAYFAVGAVGYTSAISNFLPSATLRFYRALLAGEMDTVWDITDRLVKPICGVRDRQRGYNIAFVKTGLDFVGRAGGPVRPPLVNMDRQSVEDFHRILEAWQREG